MMKESSLLSSFFQILSLDSLLPFSLYNLVCPESPDKSFLLFDSQEADERELL